MGAVKAGAVIAGKYLLEARFAQGGMGSVWAARHLSLDTRVAIKFIGPEVAALDEARTRFEREAKIAALLQSPHVVQIHDYGVDGDIPYLVMELLVGEDLGARLAERERLPVEEVASMVTQVGRALRRAAQAGIVHRDLKPGNVFLVRGDDEDEIVKVLDFGVAKAPWSTSDEATRSGAMIGSPRYMSPEQVRGSRLVDQRADLWSLAVIAYRALTGKLPFHGDDVAALLLAICDGRFTLPSQVEPSLGADFDEFFERALARDPDRRFQTARELSCAFAVAAGEPPPSASRPFMRALLPIETVRSTFATPPREIEITGPTSCREERTLREGVAPRPSQHDGNLAMAPRPSSHEGTLTSAPRTIPVAPAPPPRATLRGSIAHPIVGVAVVLAGLVGILVGQSVGHGARLPDAPRAGAAPPSDDQPTRVPPAPPSTASATATPSIAPTATATPNVPAALSARVVPPSPTLRPAARGARKHVPTGL